MKKHHKKIAVGSFTDLARAGALVRISAHNVNGFTVSAHLDRGTDEIVVERRKNGRGNRSYEVARVATEEKAAQVMADELGLDVARTVKP